MCKATGGKCLKHLQANNMATIFIVFLSFSFFCFCQNNLMSWHYSYNYTHNKVCVRVCVGVCGGGVALDFCQHS